MYKEYQIRRGVLPLDKFVKIVRSRQFLGKCSYSRGVIGEFCDASYDIGAITIEYHSDREGATMILSGPSRKENPKIGKLEEAIKNALKKKK